MKLVLKFAFLLVLTFCLSGTLIAQDEEYEYTREIIWGISKNTNGGLIGGVMIKYTQVLSPRLFQSFGLELANVKHPREIRYVNRLNGNAYIWGKKNYLYSIRPQYGRELVLFKKAAQQGVQISFILAGGPTIGLVAPYYIEYDRTNFSSQGPLATNTVVEPFDPLVHREQNRILGTGGILQGIGESKVKIGAHVKTSATFEFGAFKNNVSGFEVGFMLEAFPSKIILIPTAENRSVFTSAFITILFGVRK